MTNWKVTWNKIKYDYQRLINDYKAGIHDGIILQSKGLAHMKVIPVINDIAYVSCNGNCIMKCRIISNFITDMNEKLDPYNKGISRPHTLNDTYLKMQIIEIYDNPISLIGNRRTWTKY